MTNVRVNHENNTIVITKAFAKKASVYGTSAYKELREIKIDNPNYKVEVREVSKTTSSTNKITLSTMENYIKMHDESGKILEEFNALRKEKLGENLHKTTFFQIKKWFFGKYPELKKNEVKKVA